MSNSNILRSFPQVELTERFKKSQDAQRALADLYHVVHAKEVIGKFPTVDKISDEDISRVAKRLVDFLD